MVSSGNVPSAWIKFAPVASVLHPPALLLPFLLEAWGPEGLGASSGRDRDVCDPRLIPPLLRSVAILHLLPWLLTAFSSAASSFQPRQLRTRFSPRAVPLLPSFTGRKNRDFPEKRPRVARIEIYPGPPASPGRRSRHPPASALFMSGSFAG